MWALARLSLRVRRGEVLADVPSAKRTIVASVTVMHANMQASPPRVTHSTLIQKRNISIAAKVTNMIPPDQGVYVDLAGANIPSRDPNITGRATNQHGHVMYKVSRCKVHGQSRNTAARAASTSSRRPFDAQIPRGLWQRRSLWGVAAPIKRRASCVACNRHRLRRLQSASEQADPLAAQHACHASDQRRPIHGRREQRAGGVTPWMQHRSGIAPSNASPLRTDSARSAPPSAQGSLARTTYQLRMSPRSERTDDPLDLGCL